MNQENAGVAATGQSILSAQPAATAERLPCAMNANGLTQTQRVQVRTEPTETCQAPWPCVALAVDKCTGNAETSYHATILNLHSPRSLPSRSWDSPRHRLRDWCGSTAHSEARQIPRGMVQTQHGSKAGSKVLPKQVQASLGALQARRHPIGANTTPTATEGTQ